MIGKASEIKTKIVLDWANNGVTIDDVINEFIATLHPDTPIISIQHVVDLETDISALIIYKEVTQ